MSAERREATLQLQDGTELISDLWLPARGGPWPTLLMRQPYGKRIASTITLADPTWWVDQGYLVVIQDVRGQGDSGGTFAGFSQEPTDTAQTLNWVRSLPESNGKVGCYGFSYQGLTQLLTSDGSLPPDCLAPAMAGLDERDHWSCDGGAQWWHLGLGWGLQLAALQARRRNDDAAWTSIRRSLEDGSYLRDGQALLREHDPNGMAIRWFQSDPENDSDWITHIVPTEWLKQPMLLIGGWWDPHLRGILDLWARSIAAGGAPQLHIGPATHLQWWPGAQQLLLEFFDRHLKHSTPLSAQPAAHRWNITRATWQSAEAASAIDWQLAGDPLACHDQGHGVLTQGANGSGTVRIVHDPWRPVPAIGGHLSPVAGAADRRDLDARTDVATFTSEPLTQPLTLDGTPQLTLKAHADQPGFDLCLALSRIPLDSDHVEQLSTGCLRLRGSQAQRAQQRRILMQPLLASLDPGDRLRLSIAGASWPAIGVNSGSEVIPCGAPTSQHRVIAMTLQLAGSHLTLIPFSAGRLQHT